MNIFPIEERYLAFSSEIHAEGSNTAPSYVAALKKIVDQWDALVMMVPSADNILTDKLPSFAVYYDQTAFLEKLQTKVKRKSLLLNTGMVLLVQLNFYSKATSQNSKILLKLMFSREV